MIFVPATPESQLKDRYVREIKDAGFKIKVVEQSGITLKRMLQRSDPFKEKNCRNINCLVCSTGGKGSCRSTGVILMSWYVTFATIRTSGKHLEVLTLAIRNIYVLLSSGKKAQ